MLVGRERPGVSGRVLVSRGSDPDHLQRLRRPVGQRILDELQCVCDLVSCYLGGMRGAKGWISDAIVAKPVRA